MITSAMQPVRMQRTKPARPMSALSILRPRPGGSSTPSGAMTRNRRLLPSAVLSTITTRSTFGLSSAATCWIRAHCSRLAPGGVSHRISQSPNLPFTAPWARTDAGEATARTVQSVQKVRFAFVQDTRTDRFGPQTAAIMSPIGPAPMPGRQARQPTHPPRLANTRASGQGPGGQAPPLAGKRPDARLVSRIRDFPSWFRHSRNRLRFTRPYAARIAFSGLIALHWGLWFGTPP